MYLSGDQALHRLMAYQWGTCLDIGSGTGQHSAYIRQQGRKTITLDIGHQADIQADYLATEPFSGVEAIWCSHVLEHQVNPGLFLERIYHDLKDGGVLAITVPPLKHSIVGGHVTLWNAGLLLYQLILAGFDCRHARLGTYGYNISVVVTKTPAQLPDLVHDFGDIERIAHLLPVPVVHGFDGRLPDINW